MEFAMKANPKEIAALIVELQERQILINEKKSEINSGFQEIPKKLQSRLSEICKEQEY